MKNWKRNTPSGETWGEAIADINKWTEAALEPDSEGAMGRVWD
jgi:hypothetical protein